MMMKFYYQFGQTIKTVTVEQEGDQFSITVGDKIYHVSGVDLVQGQLIFKTKERTVRAYIAQTGSQYHVGLEGESWVLERLARPQSGHRQPGPSGGLPGGLEASMPGLVRQVLVSEGDRVERGQTLALLEAMKMELKISAPYAGLVRRVNCTPGQVVERGQVLVELEIAQ